MPAVSLTARTCREIGPPHPSDPIMGGPECRSRREARIPASDIKTRIDGGVGKRLTPTRPDREGLELRNVDANYLFERSHRFAGIQPNSGFRDYSRLSCGVGGYV